jgi:hypothetical protein
MSSKSSTSVVQLDSDSYELFDTPKETGTPERNLLMAILERAVLDYVGNDNKEAETAKEWLFGDLEESESPATSEFSFPWLCHQLDLDSRKIASQVRAMPKRGDRRIPPWYFMKKEG